MARFVHRPAPSPVIDDSDRALRPTPLRPRDKTPQRALLAFLITIGLGLLAAWALAAAVPLSPGLYWGTAGLVATAATAAGLGTLWWGTAAQLRQARRRAQDLEASALQARSMLDRIVDNVPTSLLVLDKDLNVVRTNRMARVLHGEDLVGRSCRDVSSGQCAESDCGACAVQEVFTDLRSQEDLRAGTAPRTGDAVAVDVYPIERQGGEPQALLVERVVTHQKKLQTRLIHQEKMAAFGLLAAGIAHDMGNPLSAIAMHLDLVDDAALPDETASDIRSVRQEVGRLRRILREMVGFARRRRDAEALVSVRSVVDDALRLLRHDARMRETSVTVDIDLEAPPVCIVEDHLIQVVLNLLLNSLDAMPGGGSLRIDVRQVGESVAIRVRDSGEGMDRTTLARCTEPMFTTKSPGRGTGLGLSVCGDILSAAGGRLELHSALEMGTTAVISLPAHETREEAA